MLSLCVLFLVTFFVFESYAGQKWLIERALKPGMAHFQENDVYMGAGLAPYVYLLTPAVVLGGLGIFFAVLDLKRDVTASHS
jgi:hypothetical protein